MNAGDMRWLLQTIEDPETAERFVVAQYERGRISYHAMAEIARERGWINRSAKARANPSSFLRLRPDLTGRGTALLVAAATGNGSAETQER